MRILNFLKGVRREQRGITLLELVVVLSILAVVASIVTPAVSGQTTRGRGSTKLADVAAVQSAVDNFAGDAPANSDDSTRYPVNGNKKPSASDYHAQITNFKLPDGSTTTVYVKPIDFTAAFSSSGEGSATTKTFVPDYMRSRVKHSGASGSTDPSASINASEQNTSSAKVFGNGDVSFAGGKDYTPTTGTGSGTVPPTSINVWVIDQDGRVWVLLDDGYY